MRVDRTIPVAELSDFDLVVRLAHQGNRMLSGPAGDDAHAGACIAEAARRLHRYDAARKHAAGKIGVGGLIADHPALADPGFRESSEEQR